MNKLNKTVGFIGCGNMGRAILSGLLKNQIARRQNIVVSDIDSAKAKRAAREFRVREAESNLDLIGSADLFLLAVKPQDMDTVSAEIKIHLRPRHVLVSILAGTPIRKIEAHFGDQVQIVRAMPNLGAQAGEAVTALTGPREAALHLAEIIFSGCGKVIRLPEKYFDLVTAVSGSGPAYFFLMMELLEEIGKRAGISEQAARLLAVQTAAGAAKLAQTLPYAPGVLRAMVTSKKGTTEAALQHLAKNKFSEIFKAAVHRAIHRAGELSHA
jgi:pyrroline-5-carboxylate reductase